MFVPSPRAGLGKTRYTETAELWMQDALGRRAFELVNVGSEHKPADVLTKPVPQETLFRHLGFFGCHAAHAGAHPEGAGSENGGGGFVHFSKEQLAHQPWQHTRVSPQHSLLCSSISHRGKDRSHNDEIIVCVCCTHVMLMQSHANGQFRQTIVDG